MTTNRKDQRYDNVFKVVLEEMLPFVLEQLNLEKAQVKHTALETEINKRIQRRVDGLFRIETPDQAFILHIEIQHSNAKDMVKRLKFYNALVSDRYNLPIYHAVVYLSETGGNIETMLAEAQIFRGFHLIDLSKLAIEPFLESSNPVEVVLASLGDYGGRDKAAVMETIVGRLGEMAGGELPRYLDYLGVLSGLRRGLDVILTKIVENMLDLGYDVKEHHFYKEGFLTGQRRGIDLGKQEGILIGEQRGIDLGKQEGILIGEQRGIDLGKQEGISIGKQEGIQKGILGMHANNLSVKLIARTFDLTIEEVEAILRKQGRLNET